MSDNQLRKLITIVNTGHYKTGRGEVRKMSEWRKRQALLKISAESVKRGRVVYSGNRPARATANGYESW